MRPPLSDDALLDAIQQRTLRYFWDFAHPISGMARERSNPVAGYDFLDTVTTGGTGFGVMALLAGASREFLPHAGVLARVTRIVEFLACCETHHGVFPHFLHGRTGAIVPFSEFDDGADLVETSFLMMGLLSAREFFSGAAAEEGALREKIEKLWHAVQWDRYTRGETVLYWHWSPRHGWAMNHPITGWNECLITYVLAASSPSFPISPDVYHAGWANSPHFRNGNSYYGIRLPLGPPFGGPLFFAHYSFLGLDPRGLKDRYADYWEQNRAHALINRAHCIANPNGFRGYGPDCWGLTACDGHAGYNAFSPNNDLGVIAPTAALASMPYMSEGSIAAARRFFRIMDGRLWREYGFLDSFNSSTDWIAEGHLAIDEGPIAVMIENHRSGLLWTLFMRCPEVMTGLGRLGFNLAPGRAA
jgi:hypothetical protein